MTDKKLVKLGLVQMRCVSDRAENVDNAVRKIGEAAKKGAQVVCLPELFTAPYFAQEKKAEVTPYEEEIPGPTTKALSAEAKEHGIIIIGGSVYEKAEGKFYNTTPVLGADGKLLGTYQKVHVPQDPSFYEKNYFAPGNQGYKVFKTPHGKIGTMICYDQWYPEAARANALLGAEMIFYPTAIGTVEGVEQAEGNWQEAWENVQRGHAIANGMVVTAVNRVGKEGKMTFWGGSFVIDQFGKTLARAGKEEEVVVVACDLQLGEDVREGWRFFYNRRPDTYGTLTKK